MADCRLVVSKCIRWQWTLFDFRDEFILTSMGSWEDKQEAIAWAERVLCSMKQVDKVEVEETS